MQIGNGLNAGGILGPVGVASTQAQTSARPGGAGGSVFGPPAQVSLGEGVPSVVGFTDYTKLATAGQWQFNLAGVLTPTTRGVTPTARSPEQQKAAEEALKNIFALLDAGKYEDARRSANQLLDEDQTSAAATQALGFVDLAEGKYDQAERLFLRAHALDPAAGYDNDARNARVLQGEDAGVLQTARQWLTSQAKREEGIRVLITLTERSPDNAEAHFVLGDALLKKGDGDNGLMQFSVAIQHADGSLLTRLEERLAQLAADTPQSAFIRQLLGKTYLRQERFDAAAQILQQAGRLAENSTAYNHDLARAYVGLGRAQLARGDLAAALAQLKLAKELDPTTRDVKRAYAEALLARAEQHAKRHDHAAASTDYSALVDLLAKDGTKELRQRAAQGAYAVGRALMNKRIAAGSDITDEVAAFQAAYDLESGNATYRQQLATTRYALGEQQAADGDYNNAAYSYRRAWELYKGNTTYRDKAISAFVAYGDDRAFNLNYTAAIDAYRAAYELNIYHQGNKQKLADAYNARGLDYKQQELYAKAALDFKEALALFPDNATYQSNYNLVSPWDPNG
jgi:tetratricopeptide (TPR) repeat protein